MTKLIGQSLGQYHILEQLGEGGMAVVYKAYDTRLERNVAIKVILPQKQHTEKFIRRFEREAKALAQLSHPNIVKVIDYGEHEGLPYLVMEFLPGGTLKHKLLGQPMPWLEALQLLQPIARALAHAHEHRIIHRDIKPSNILITESGEPMLSDFGIAKILEAEETLDLTGTGSGVGTPEYMSPEQAQGKQVDGRSDAYSLGIVLYEMLTGRKPYRADTPYAVVIKHVNEPLPRPKQFVKDLPDAVEQILLKVLAKKPEDRYSSMSDLITALEKLARAEVPARARKPAVNRRPLRIGLALLVIGLLSLAGMLWVSGIIADPRDQASSPAAPNPASPAHVTSQAGILQVPTPQLVTRLEIPSDSNTGVNFQVLQTGLYMFRHADSAYRTCSRCSWSTTVHGFRGPEPQWIERDNLIAPDEDAALFVLNRGGHSSKEVAVQISQGNSATVNLTAGDWVTLITDDFKPDYGDNRGEVLIDIFVVARGANASQPAGTKFFLEDAEPTPLAAETQTNPADGAELILVPGATFEMGLTDTQADALRLTCSNCRDLLTASQPPHTVTLDSYWIYKTEVSNEMYQLCVKAGKCEPPVRYNSETRGTYYNNPEFANYPVVFVTSFAAEQYCQWAGGHLPTEAQWEYAARGPSGNLYPWGENLPDESLANVANFLSDTTPIDAYAEGASPFGLLNMTGNVWEWVYDWYRADYYQTEITWLNPLGSTTADKIDGESLRAGRGGAFWISAGNSGGGIRDWFQAGQAGSAVGFRCAFWEVDQIGADH